MADDTTRQQVELPNLRVDSQLLQALCSVLRTGETVSDFIEAAVRHQVQARMTDAAFQQHGEAAWQDYLRTGQAHPVDDVLAEMRVMTEKRRAALTARGDIKASAVAKSDAASARGL